MTQQYQTSLPAKSNLDRIFAIALSVLSVLALFVPYRIITQGADGSFTADAKFLFLGFGGEMKGVGLLATIFVILMLGAALASAIINILAIFKTYDTPELISAGSIVLSAGAGIYTLSVLALSIYQSMAGRNLSKTLDITSLLLAIASFAIFAVITWRNNGKYILKTAGFYGLTMVSTVLLVIAVVLTGAKVNILILALTVLACLSLVFSQVCVMYDFDLETLDRIRYIAHLAISFILCLLCLFDLGAKAFILAFLGTVAAAVPVAASFIKSNYDEEDEDTEMKTMKEEYTYDYSETNEEEYSGNEPELEMFPSIPRSKMVAQNEPEMFPSIPRRKATMDMPFGHPAAAPAAAAPVNPFEGYKVEEYAEAIAYEGGPVAGVELAEEVNPTFIPKGQVSTGGYDFYNCQSFDPFIASLNNEERNQFTEIFILKYKGTMPELPDYVVGGDNSEFFRKIFIYLGQYRDRIPNGLLSKIYSFSTKIS